jgi:hypothetical protein
LEVPEPQVEGNVGLLVLLADENIGNLASGSSNTDKVPAMAPSVVEFRKQAMDAEELAVKEAEMMRLVKYRS